MAEVKPKVQYKVIVIGQGGTGKTSIINRYVRGQFSKNYKITVGVDFALKVIEMDDVNVHLQLWDIAGQERFGAMTRVYYKEAVAAIIVFDITNRKTFGAVDVWLKDVNEKLNLDSNREPVPIMLLANKADLLKERPACIEDSELEQFVSDNGLIGYFKTSAKDNDQIADAMKFLVGRLREKEPVKTIASPDTFSLHQPPPPSSNNASSAPPQTTCCSK